ncbi:MAG TPA: hypothetical protein VJ438_04095 [Candidatus Nanoarchaeia archaeon]|nr:hypothetical protein [Candidatus Nanoarchaeia archaeon]
MGDIRFEVVKKIAATNFKIKDLKDISKLDTASPPSIFIGSKLRYPLVNVGIMSPIERDEDAWVYDDEKYWAENNFEISDVLNLRNSLLNSRFQSKVTDTRLNKKFVNLAQEIAIASKPVDVEIELENRVRFGRNKDQVLTPHGMRASLKQAKVTSNVKVDRLVDKAINDDIKANESVTSLYDRSFSEYTLNKILSVGVLGLKKNKRLVPTRWSITATDDMIGKHLLDRVRRHKWIENFELHFGEFMGNSYLILFFPGVWSYELFELYLPGSSWNPTSQIKASTDMEGFHGRKNYAFNTVGGYYATRLPILGYLDKMKRQASVLAIRIEGPSYWAALGVWVVRESVKKAMSNKSLKFDSKNELIEGSKKIGKIKFNFDYDSIFQQSKLLKQIKNQQNLMDWLKK